MWWYVTDEMHVRSWRNRRTANAYDDDVVRGKTYRNTFPLSTG